MTISKLRIIYAVILVGIIAIMIVTIIQDPSNTAFLVKCAALLIACIAAIVKLESWRHSFVGRSYELKYQELIGEAFTDNKTARKQLINGIILYNDGKYDAAVSKFDDLRKDCIGPADYAAVLTFRALCFSDRKGYDEAIATYKELLEHDPENSRAWSNMGMSYGKSGRSDLAADAYCNAIRANDKNAYAHTNYAHLLLDMIGEDETENNKNNTEALKHAKIALEIDATLMPALSMACQASARIGDEKGAQEYLKQFGRAGGDWRALKEVIDEEIAFARELAMEDDL